MIQRKGPSGKASSDVVVSIESLELLRSVKGRPVTVYIDGEGFWDWNPTSIVTDTGDSSTTAVAVGDESVGRYERSSALSLSPDGVPPEESSEVTRVVTSEWWTKIAGLTPLKYVDARYSGQAAGVISAWDDLSGGQDLIQVIEAQNPELVTSGFIGDNGQYVQFLPASPSTPKLLSGSDVTAGLTVPCTLAIVARHYNTDSTVKTIAELRDGGIFRWSVSNTASSATVQNNQGGPLITRTNPNARVTSTRVNLHAVVVNNGDSYLWDNGIRANVNLDFQGTWEPTTAQMGAQGTTLNGFQGEMRSGIMLEGAATQAQLEAIFSGLCGQVPTNLVLIGDGLTNASLIAQTSELLKEYTWVDSDAATSSTLVDMLARFPANVTPKYQPAMRNVLVVWGGSEDIYLGANGSTTASRLWEICDLGHRLGWRVIPISMLPRGAFSTTQNSYVSTFNSEFSSRWRTHSDAVIYAQKISGLTAYNSTYWNSDRFSLNTAGSSLIARAISSTVRTLCQS